MNSNFLKDGMDALAASTLVASFLGWLPVIATLLTIVWMAIRIYESNTVRGWMKR